MLGVKAYPQDYIDSCRARIEADLTGYRGLLTAAKQSGNESAIDAFENAFFSSLVLNLDFFFVHRLRTLEGKDGNPMNEVRVLCNSLLENDGVMRLEKGIKLSPRSSVLKFDDGDQIKLTEADFLRLADAYFAAIESKFREE